MKISELYYEDYVKKDVDAASSFVWEKDPEVSMYEFKMEGFHHNFIIRLFHTPKNVLTIRNEYGYPVKVKTSNLESYTIDCSWIKPILTELLDYNDPSITATFIVKNFYI